ncbi:MAG: hypothetical protein GF399_12145 [Candidatus Coatesbacteria bacterium]|nr:hypothetical protein [Candidatus Coatesbacteria bacterium]
MKQISLILVILVGLAAAEVLWENPYGFSEVEGGYSAYDTTHSLDDFVLDSQSDIEAFVTWNIYDGSHPRDLLVALSYDDGGVPGSVFWAVNVDAADITTTDTGEDLYTLDIIETRLELDPADVYEDLAPGTYWFEVHDQGDDLFAWLYENGGNMHVNDEDKGVSAFFVVEGTPNSAVVGSSWGRIKALD